MNTKIPRIPVVNLVRFNNSSSKADLIEQKRLISLEYYSVLVILIKKDFCSNLENIIRVTPISERDIKY